jgi:hypothetical protein
MKSGLRLLHAAIVAGVLLGAQSAFAQQNCGYVQGRLLFFQAQGNWCDAPNGFDCTGAFYLNTEVNTFQPVKEVKLKILAADNSVIGQGSTDAGGQFVVHWCASLSQDFTQSKLQWRTDNANGRFKVTDLNGNVQVHTTNSFGLFAAEGVRDIGDRFWGNASAPNSLDNVYDGAWKMWTNNVQNAPKMVTDFTNVQIRGFTSTTGTDCPSSCADGPNKIIKLSSDSPLRPDPRVMHEMGHIVSWLSDRRKPMGTRDGSYSYSGNTPNAWALNSVEFKAAAFEEALATVFGDMALYGWWANQPFTCFPASPGAACTLPSNTSSLNYDLEADANVCRADASHQIVNTIHLLWDVWDGPNNGEDSSNVCNCGAPGCQVWNDTDGQDFVDFVNVLANYAAGTGANQKDEPWNSDRTKITEPEGRGYINFRNNWRDRGPAARDITNNVCLNCMNVF